MLHRRQLHVVETCKPTQTATMFRALCVLLLAASLLAYHVTRREFVPLIINGDDADVGEWPHQCSFQDDTGFHFCGSVYLGGDWVLTAAHCAVGNSPSSVRVVCGILNRSDATDADTYEVVDLIVHPDYDSFTLENDHALIQLAEVPSGDNIASIFVEDVGGDNWVGSDCYITGWGDNENGVNPDTLQEAAVLALSQADCEDAYSQTPYDVFEDMVCVGHDNDVYVGGCYGDSGGPFVCRQTPDEPYTLVGVASWAYPPCGADEYPTVYSRSAFFRDWISENCGDCI